MSYPSMLRILAITAGVESKRNPFCMSLADLYGAEVLAGKARVEIPTDRLLRSLGLAEILGTHAKNIRSLNREILRREFEVLFVVKGNFVTAATLKALRARLTPPKIIGWSPDDIYLPHNNSSILRAAAPYYDTFFTAKSLNIVNGELQQMGFKDPRFLHQGYDLAVHRPLPNPASRFSGLVTFVGFGEQDRFDKVNYLAANGIPVHVWGNGWTRRMRASAHRNLHIYGYALHGNDYVDALSNSAISLCFLRKLNRDLHTSRTFEIPACGGFMIAERTDEHRSYFVEEEEAVYFEGEAELLSQVRRFLDDPQAREAIAKAGRQRSESSDYSYHRLARQVITAAMVEGVDTLTAQEQKL